jgi:phage terminase Nu1 subunit (DNA packaging protein)
MSSTDNTQPRDVIAKLLDITPARVNQLVNEGVIPKTARGRYPLVGAVQGYIRYLRARTVKSEIPADDIDPRRERALLNKAQRLRVELETAEKRGKLLPAETVNEIGGGLVVAFRAKMLQVHHRIKQRYPHIDTEVLENIRVAHWEALDELAAADLPAEVMERIGQTSDDNE